MYRQVYFKPVYYAAFTAGTGIAILSGDLSKGRVESKAVQLSSKALSEHFYLCN